MRKRWRWVAAGCAVVCVWIAWSVWSGNAFRQMEDTYEVGFSKITVDRNGEILGIEKNVYGRHALRMDALPPELAELSVAKEDGGFYWHPGINLVSILRAVAEAVLGGSRASSTITQQTAKLLLHHTEERTMANKVVELFYAFALEGHLTKQEILTWYANSAYFGNQMQGIRAASLYYYGAEPAALTSIQRVQLTATLSAPTSRNPEMPGNVPASEHLARRVGVDTAFAVADGKAGTAFAARAKTPEYFEYSHMDAACPGGKTTLDAALTRELRHALAEQLDTLRKDGAEQAAAIVIDAKTNEVLAMIGSSDPESTAHGDQIDMLHAARPIGSTIKPFLYARGFDEGLRPYTKVDDREYRYTTALGFPHYPKNYDYQYHGEVTLHQALSNSLNVPTVKVLEHIGVRDFAKFAESALRLHPVQSFDTYQYGIALGQVELPLIDLAAAFTVFPRQGVLTPITFCKAVGSREGARVFSAGAAQMVNRILTDRATGADQFGMVTNLAIPGQKVAVKTGTSREYHDSWVVGYTPDVLVAVWVGTARNIAMEELSGAMGAGAVWQRLMTAALAKYGKGAEFPDELLMDVPLYGDTQVGLKGEDPEKQILTLAPGRAVRFPQDGDTLLYEAGMAIPLEASENVAWSDSEGTFANGAQATYRPRGPGVIEITARTESGKEERIRLTLETPGE